MHDQIGHKTTCDWDRMNFYRRYVHPAWTDVSKTSVRNDLQRTGAEIIDFLVFRKYFGQKSVAKNERLRWTIQYTVYDEV